MSISFNRYVEIISAVGGANQVANRNLIARIFTPNPLVPVDSIAVFNNLAGVGLYFGTTSEEYLRANFYFGFISKKITSPQSISFGRLVPDAVAPQIYGAEAAALATLQAVSNGSFNLSMGGVLLPITGVNFSATAVAPKINGAQTAILTALQAVSNGSFSLTIAGVTLNLTGIDLSGAGSFAAIATILQTAVRTGIGTQFTSATVTYNGTSLGFDLTGGSQVIASISVTAGVVGTDISGLIGWFPQGSSNALPQWVSGTTAVATYAAVAAVLEDYIQTGVGTQFTSAAVTYNNATTGFNLVGGDPVDAVLFVSQGTSGTDISGLIGWYPGNTGGAIWSNGSAGETITESLTTSENLSNNFGSFCPTYSAEWSLDDVTEAANWNLARNNTYFYSISVTNTNASAWSAALVNNAPGAGFTLFEDGEFQEMLPMAIEASTNYAQPNAAQSYMWQSATLTPTVTDDTDADLYDGLRINYYGQTQNAGIPITFYQRGVLLGNPGTSPGNMNTYINEIWLKDAMGVAMINLLLSASAVGADLQGAANMQVVGQPVIDQAILNGTISLGKALTQQQILFINEITQDPLAWQQVQNAGFWFGVSISSEVVESGLTEFTGNYLLVYSKQDTISKIEGQHVLI